MGTRSLTHVISTYKDKDKQKKERLLCMYRQFDGYPSGMGAGLVSFLHDSKVVNGLGLDVKEQKIFNGAGCLAAQLVAHFKDGPGGIYIYPTNTNNSGVDYEYEICVDYDTHKVTFRCFSIEFRIEFRKDKKGNTIYKDGQYKTKRVKLFEGESDNFLEAMEKLNQESETN